MRYKLRMSLAWIASLLFIASMFALQLTDIEWPVRLVFWLIMPAMVLAIYFLVGNAEAKP